MKPKHRMLALIATAIVVTAAVVIAIVLMTQTVPSLQTVASMPSDTVNDRLNGLSQTAIRDAWGKPDGSLSGFWGEYWVLPEDGTVTVYYDENGLVEHVLVSYEKTDIHYVGASVPAEELSVTVSRVNYCMGDERYLPALNADKLSISSVQHLPIFKFETADEFRRFQNDYRDMFSMDVRHGDSPSFTEVTRSMDAAHFEDHTLLVVYVPANSGSYRFGVRDVYADDGQLCVHVEQTNHPEAVTMDMAGWFVTVSLDKGYTATVTSFDADLNNPSD